MKFESEQISSKDLKSGDIFSDRDAEWYNSQKPKEGLAGIGLGVFIRTNSPHPKGQGAQHVHRLRIVK